MADRPPDKDQVIKDFAGYVSPGKVAVYQALGTTIVPGRREGVRVWDLDGKRSWIECRCAGGVFNLGHRPRHHVCSPPPRSRSGDDGAAGDVGVQFHGDHG